MAFDPQVASQTLVEFAQTVTRQPLVVLRDTERALRVRTVDTLVPLLPDRPATRMEQASQWAESILDQLAEIDLQSLSDAELRPARIQVGLMLVGFGGLMVAFLLLYHQSFHAQFPTLAQARRSWYQYVWFVSLGVTGMFMLGREAMRGREWLNDSGNPRVAAWLNQVDQGWHSLVERIAALLQDDRPLP